MTANQADYSIQMVSRTLGVSRSGLYAHHIRPPSARSMADKALSERITKIHDASKETCGEYLFVVLLMMLHPTQVLEPPANPGGSTLACMFFLHFIVICLCKGCTKHG